MNDTITIQCAVNTDAGTEVCLKWILPANSSNRITISDRSQTREKNSITKISKILTIREATIEDAGLYICRVRLIKDRNN